MKDETDFKDRNMAKRGTQNRVLPFLKTHMGIPLSEISTTISTNLDNNVRLTISNVC